MVFDVFLWYCHRLLQMKLQWVMKSINCDKVMLLSNLTSCDGILYRIITAMCTFQNKLQKDTVNLIWQFLIEEGLYFKKPNFSWITPKNINYEWHLWDYFEFQNVSKQNAFFSWKIIMLKWNWMLCLFLKS